jgi:hypothetical protein
VLPTEPLAPPELLVESWEFELQADRDATSKSAALLGKVAVAEQAKR